MHKILIYLHIFIKILYMFRTFPCSSSGDLRRYCIYIYIYIYIYMQPLVLSLSAGDSPVHRLRKKASYIQLRRRPPEDEQGNARNM